MVVAGCLAAVTIHGAGTVEVSATRQHSTGRRTGFAVASHGKLAGSGTHAAFAAGQRPGGAGVGGWSPQTKLVSGPRPGAKSRSPSAAEPAAKPAEALLHLIFAVVFGIFLGVGLLKFSTPPIMEKYVDRPEDLAQWIFYQW